MNLFARLNKKYIEWFLKREQVRQGKRHLTEEDQKRKEIADGFRKLYHFVGWLNTKGLTNRHQRKAFWRRVREGEPVLEKVIKQLYERYEVKTPDVKIDPKKMKSI